MGSHCFYRRKNKKDKEDNLIFLISIFPKVVDQLKYNLNNLP